jgi:crotonobetainyl-CoA:carnitine CoA-transferase CaiB-like acyl-CoA transferase
MGMSQKLPLQGIRVLEAGAYISGPYAGALLASLGADVVKIEPIRGGDAFRRGVEIDSPYFVQYNAGKRSLAVDLKRPEGRQLIKALLPHYDVFIENSRPGKMAALGLSYDDCTAINPHLIYSSASGFGDGGSYRDRAAYDSMGQSMGGYYSIMNDAGTPRLTGTCIADLITAIGATMGILAALVGREMDPERRGNFTQTSLLEAMSTITIDAMTQFYETGDTPTREARHPQAQNFCLLTASGGSITLHLSSSEKFWQALAHAMERPDLIEDARFRKYHDRMANYFELLPIVEKEFLKRSQSEWETILIKHDVPFAPVLTMQELASHPQTQWLSLLEPERNGNVLVRPPWRFMGERPRRAFDAPYIGEHSREVSLEVQSEREVEQLLRDGVIFQAGEQRTEDSRAVSAV